MAPLDSLRTALSDRYRLDRLLGQGGMATVYLARDLKHDRDVALKVLRPELAAVLGRERFLTEIRLTAKLDHPHILTLIDSGESDDFLWYVLPYVRGESLRDRLNHEKQLPIEEAVAITKQVAGALDYAHQHGVIHRDIKPENILFHEGEAMLADFGIALAVKEASGNRLTETGLSLGTPQYMSPEQATGDRQLDARSDVYSLAAVLYEMLAGEPPLTGSTVQAIIAKLMTERPTRLRVVRDTVPEGIDAAVAKALAKVPADRYSSAQDFASELEITRDAAGLVDAPRRKSKLKWPAIVIAVVIALAGATTLFRPPLKPTASVERAQLTSTGKALHPVISPDGKQVAYETRECPNGSTSCRWWLLLQDLSGGRPIVLDSANVGLIPVRWTSDGANIAYVATDSSAAGIRSGAYLMPRLGGPSRLIAPGASLWTWDLDGAADSVVFVVASTPVHDSLELHVRPIAGGAERIVHVRLSGGANSVSVSPDRRWFAILAFRGYGAHGTRAILAIASRSGVTADTVSLAALNQVRWSPNGDAVYLFVPGHGREDELVRIAVNKQTGHFRAAVDTVLSVPTGVGGGTFDISRDGSEIAYWTGSVLSEFWALEARGKAVTSRLLRSSTAYQASAMLSPDGRTVAFIQSDNLGENIYTLPFAGGSATPLTASAVSYDALAWSPDSRGLAATQLSHNGGVTFVSVPQAGTPTMITSQSPENFKVADSAVVLQYLSRLEWFSDAGRHLHTLTIPDSLTDPYVVAVSRDGRHVLFNSWQPLPTWHLNWYTIGPQGEISPAPFATTSNFIIELQWPQEDINVYAVFPPTMFDVAKPVLWRDVGGRTTRLSELPLECTYLSMSSDGRRFVCDKTTLQSDIVLVRHFDRAEGR